MQSDFITENDIKEETKSTLMAFFGNVASGIDYDSFKNYPRVTKFALVTGVSLSKFKKGTQITFNFSIFKDENISQKTTLGDILSNDISSLNSGGKIYNRHDDGEYYFGDEKLEIFTGTMIQISNF